jgi:small conductance mechanosensitive channel
MDLTKTIQYFIDWSLSHGLKVVIILIGTIIFNNFLRSLLKRRFKEEVENAINGDGKKQRLKTIIEILDDIMAGAVWVISVLMILSEIGVDTSPLLAAIGAVGLAFGFAARGIAKDFLQGVFILIEDQFRIGDEVEIAGLKGRVIDLNPRTTILKTIDGKIHTIPNREIKIVSKNQ